MLAERGAAGIDDDVGGGGSSGGAGSSGGGCGGGGGNPDGAVAKLKARIEAQKQWRPEGNARGGTEEAKLSDRDIERDRSQVSTT